MLLFFVIMKFSTEHVIRKEVCIMVIIIICCTFSFLRENVREDCVTKISSLETSNQTILSSENSATRTCEYWRLVSSST
jgi:uncharacterized membrane protein YfhO